ncbi:FecR domain-containing protein [Variovorax sp. VaC1]|uniref:FecR domain-containing protein n=1 Tax=Variovorax sp. VaC1 TaxID=3373132 RepID=UPI003749C2DA
MRTPQPESTATVHGTGAPARTELDVRKEAVAWYARLCSGDALEADKAAWQRWRQAHPDHQRAWQRLEAMQATLRRVPGHIAASTLRAAQPDRRRVLRGIGVVASGGALAYLSWQAVDAQGGWHAWLADHRTGTGEQQSVELADGSKLLLNTRTSVDVAMNASRRVVRLREGEILVETAKHRGLRVDAQVDARPFTVETDHGRIVALGTRFTVRRDGDRTAVTVLEDAVEIRASEAPEQAVVLRAGQQVGFTRGRIDTPRQADPASAEWAQGSLVVNDWRLGDVVAELSRYRRGRLACDPAVEDLRVSGAFPLQDTDKALAVIARSLPVRVFAMTRYWVTLGPL